MTPSRKRTLLGILLFLPLAAVLLLTFACLPAPVGDPDQSKIDAKLTGAWQSDVKDGESTIALLRPWDAHTYYLQYMEIKEGKEVPGLLHFKAWLTKIGDATFLTAEPLDNLDYAFGVKDDKPWWFVGRIDVKDNTIKFRPVNEKSSFLKDLDTREKLEAAIKAQVNNDELYNESMTFKRIDTKDIKIVEDALKQHGIGK